MSTGEVGASVLVPVDVEARLGTGFPRHPAPLVGTGKPVAQMTDEEKTRALLVDELTGLGNRRAWENRERRPVQAMLDVEGLKWINDSVGWPAGDELLRLVAAAITDAGVSGYRLGGDEFAFEGPDEPAVASAIARIRRRLSDASIDVIGRDGSRRRLQGPRVHAGIGRSLEAAAQALRRAKKAGIAAGERAARGMRPRGLAEVSLAPGSLGARHAGLAGRVAALFRVLGRILGGADERVFRFYVRALREADPGFGLGEKTEGGLSQLSLEWLVRDARRRAS